MLSPTVTVAPFAADAVIAGLTLVFTGNIKADRLRVEIIPGFGISDGCQWNLYFTVVWKICIGKFHCSMKCTRVYIVDHLRHHRYR